jgi:predicted transglutaminase-like cysteine proteinase
MVALRGLMGATARRFAALAILPFALLAGPAVAGKAMDTGGLTSQPIGHYEFCKMNPEECSIRLTDRGPAVLSERMWATVRAINERVNTVVRPVSDLDLYGRDEFWAYPTANAGDCEDYVLEKRRQLRKAGISLTNLLITVVRKPDDEGHAVLTLRTSEGDFVLDNLRDDIRLWTETGYRFLKRQSSTHTGRWVSLREDNNMLVGAVKP